MHATQRAPLPGLKAHDYQQSLSVVQWSAEGRVVAASGSAPLPKFDETEGFADLNLGSPPVAWRSFSQWNADRSRKIMVLVAVRERDELAQDIAEQMIEPGLWLLPVVALAWGWLCAGAQAAVRPVRRCGCAGPRGRPTSGLSERLEGIRVGRGFHQHLAGPPAGGHGP